MHVWKWMVRLPVTYLRICWCIYLCGVYWFEKVWIDVFECMFEYINNCDLPVCTYKVTQLVRIVFQLVADRACYLTWTLQQAWLFAQVLWAASYVSCNAEDECSVIGCFMLICNIVGYCHCTCLRMLAANYLVWMPPDSARSFLWQYSSAKAPASLASLQIDSLGA